MIKSKEKKSHTPLLLIAFFRKTFLTCYLRILHVFWWYPLPKSSNSSQTTVNHFSFHHNVFLTHWTQLLLLVHAKTKGRDIEPHFDPGLGLEEKLEPVLSFETGLSYFVSQWLSESCLALPLPCHCWGRALQLALSVMPYIPSCFPASYVILPHPKSLSLCSEFIQMRGWCHRVEFHLEHGHHTRSHISEENRLSPSSHELSVTPLLGWGILWFLSSVHTGVLTGLISCRTQLLLSSCV